jgi:hypothetical protein
MLCNGVKPGQIDRVELFGLVFMVIALVLIGIGIGIGIVGCLLAAALVGLGVISSSFAAGLLSRRAVVGFRVFLVQCGVLAGIPAGAFCAWLTQSLFAAYGSGWPVLIYGALGGAFAGLFVALVVAFIGQSVQGWAARRLQPALQRLNPQQPAEARVANAARLAAPTIDIPPTAP